MCGILGANTDEFSVREGLRYMHRGEEELRFARVGDASFGFQRHAVVAVDEEITQPYRSGGHVTLANGELFGHRELRASLRQPGRPEGTDIEVLHHLLLERGVEAIGELNMMIAGALYEEGSGRLTLFRDWIGEEPLHYVFDESTGRWCFGSTIASVTRATRAPLARIREVTPGTIVRLSPWGDTEVRYYDVETTPTLEDVDYEEVTTRTRELLERSAAARTWTEVPVACLVSGGTDSLITLYLLLKYGKFDKPLPIYTFHCDDLPVGPGTDLFHAKQVAQFFGSRVEHRIVTVSRKDVIDAIPFVVQALEDKRGRDFNVFTAIYNRFLAEVIARDGNKVVYEGEGPDEALGTYSSWRSSTISSEDMAKPRFRKRLLANLHKGVLLRTSKVMMHFGPLECRSFFLDRDLLTFLASLPPEIVRRGDRKKGVLVDAFVDVLPRELLERPKARPQDATGITRILDGLTEEELNFRRILEEYLDQLRQNRYVSWHPPASLMPPLR